MAKPGTPTRKVTAQKIAGKFRIVYSDLDANGDIEFAKGPGGVPLDQNADKSLGFSTAKEAQRVWAAHNQKIANGKKAAAFEASLA